MIYLNDFALDTQNRLSLGCVSSGSQSSFTNQARPRHGLITLKGEDNEISTLRHNSALQRGSSKGSEGNEEEIVGNNLRRHLILWIVYGGWIISKSGGGSVCEVQEGRGRKREVQGKGFCSLECAVQQGGQKRKWQ